MSVDSADEDPVEYYSTEEAVRIARSEALRSYQETDVLVQYVAHLSEFHDYCLCEFTNEGGHWVKTYRCLTPGERAPGEEISDKTIKDLVMSGNMVSAIRLYRSKHQVGLKHAFDMLRLLEGEWLAAAGHPLPNRDA